MNRFALTTEERAVFDRVASALGTVSEASQYKVLKFTAHMMDREVVRIGAVRAAAAVAGSTAHAKSDAAGEKKIASKKQSSQGTPQGYPKAFIEGPGREVLAVQAACKAALSNPPTEDQRAALRAASENTRRIFRGFNTVEAEETKE